MDLRSGWAAVRRALRGARVLVGGAAAAALVATAAPADVARGLTWLQAQIQPDGGLAGTQEPGALQQARCEAAATLARLSGPGTQLTSLLAALQAQSADEATELVACAQAVRQQLGESFLTSEIEQRRVPGHGYAAYAGMSASSAIDTGWALAAQLRNLQGAGKESLLAWLQATQAGDGSFATAGRADLLATATILRGLGGEVSVNPVAAAIAGKAAGWLLAQRSQGHWASDVAVTALVFEAVHPYSGADASIAAGVESYLLARQQSDGSWLGDAHATAVALRALALVGVPALDPTRSGLKLKFIDARTAAPVPGVQLVSATPAVSAQSDAAGGIQLTGLASGSYRFSVSAAGYAGVSLSATLGAGQTLDLGTIQLIAPVGATSATISGTVREQGSNAPIAGATVTVEGRALTATTAPDGSYLIAGVAPGAVTLTASKAGYLAAGGTAQAQAGQVLNFSPWLSADSGAAAGCRIQGLVLDAQTQQPVAGVIVSTTGGNTASATTGADGRYTMPGLVSGAIRITASKAGYDSVSANAQISCSPTRPTVSDFSPRLYATSQSPLEANTAAIAGVVVNAATNAPIAQAQLTLTPSTGAVRGAQSAADGSFSFGGLDAVSVQLQVQAAGYEGVTLTYSLTPLQPLDIGQVRLRAPKVEQLMADLKVLQVQRGTARTDAQTLQLGGQVHVTVANGGTQQAAAGVALTAFEDLNRNDRFDPGVDPVLGTAALAQSLPPAATASVSIGVQGAMAFRDAPVHVVVDPGAASADADRDNNVGSTAQAALSQPQASAFNPKLKWEWFGGSGPLPTWDNVEMTPISVPTRDTNGDGKIDAKDTPTVLASFFTASGRNTDYWPAVVRAFDGATGQLLATSPTDRPVYTLGQLAAADIDGDGAVEVLALGVDGRIHAFNGADLSLKWIAASNTSVGNALPFSGPNLADLDGDGRSEILIGNVALRHDGSLLWKAPTSVLPNCIEQRGCSPYLIDLGEAGGRAVVYGHALVNAANGTLKWSRSDLPFGMGAVAAFGPDAKPAVAVVSGSAGKIYMLDAATGQTVWGPNTIPGVRCYHLGGPPTIGDFNGDGVPDIGVATCLHYVVFNADGSVLWSAPLDTPDTSGFTGSTLFDLDGDGTAEVVYANEYELYVLRGTDGARVFKTPNYSGTGMEYPIVADVDLDGSADIVIGGNSYFRKGAGLSATTPMRGLRVLQDTSNAWVGSRSIWNQHAYHIDNINDDLTVPRVPVQSWKTHNTFRLNKRLDGDARAVPDLTVGYLRVADGGAAGSQLTVRVGNAGSYAAAATTRLAVYSSNPALGTPTASALVGTATVGAELRPGQWRDAVIGVGRDLAGLNALGQIWIVGDDDGRGQRSLQDFDRTNNTLQGDLPAVAVHLVPGVAADKPIYTEADVAAFTASVRNGGSFPQAVAVRFTVLDADSKVVETLALTASVSVPAGGTASVAAPWPVAGVLAGSYGLRAELVSPAGLVYGAASTVFGVTASQGQAALARITADRMRYSAAQTVQLTSRAGNATANTLLEGVTAKIEVTGSGGATVLARSEAIGQLAPAGSRQWSYSLPASGLAAGAYQARLQLLDAGGGVLAQSSTSFTVMGADQTGVGLSGNLLASPATLLAGQTTQLALAAINDAATGLGDVPVTLRVVDPDAGTVVASFSATAADWLPGQVRNFNVGWLAAGSDGQILVAVASAQVNGNEVPLGQANLRILGIRYTGMLMADPGEVEAGSNVTLAYSVTNPAPVAGRMQGSLAVRTQDGQQLAAVPLELDISPGSTFVGSQPYTTTEQQQMLTAVLSQQLGTSSVVLSTATFTVVDAPVPVGLDTVTRPAGRVLVLVTCPPGLGSQEEAACVAQRSQAIEMYLAALGFHGKAVSTEQSFLDALRCGAYSTYWLSGGGAKLGAGTVGELKEAVRRGEALWMDGVHDARNQLLHEVAGVKEIGKLSVRDQVASLAEGGLYGAQGLQTLGQPTHFELTTGKAEGVFAASGGKQGGVPAVVSNDWGSGRSLLFAFDLAGMVTADAVAAGGQLAAVVNASASHARGGTPTLTVGDTMRLAASVTNQGTRTVSFRAEATLPAGMVSLATMPQAQLTANADGTTQASWTFTLDGGQTRQLAWEVRAAQAGDHGVPIAVYSLPRAGSTAQPRLRASGAFLVQVRAGETLVQQAQAEIELLQPTASADQTDRTKAQQAVAQARTLHAQGAYEQAIAQWLAAAEALARITSADTRQAGRAVALALEATTDAQCIQRCGSTDCQ